MPRHARLVHLPLDIADLSGKAIAARIDARVAELLGPDPLVRQAAPAEPELEEA